MQVLDPDRIGRDDEFAMVAGDRIIPNLQGVVRRAPHGNPILEQVASLPFETGGENDQPSHEMTVSIQLPTKLEARVWIICPKGK